MFWEFRMNKKQKNTTYTDLYSPFINSSLSRDQSHQPQTQTPKKLSTYYRPSCREWEPRQDELSRRKTTTLQVEEPPSQR